MIYEERAIEYARKANEEMDVLRPLSHKDRVRTHKEERMKCVQLDSNCMMSWSNIEWFGV